MTDPSSELPPGAPAELERIWRSGLRIDGQGRLWHEGGEVTHPRLRRALLGWLDRDRAGRIVIRTGRDRYASVEVEDAALLATSARWVEDQAFLLLNDGSEEELAYATLSIGDHDALYCRVRGGHLDARLTTAAYYVIAERIEEVDEQFRLVPRPHTALSVLGATYLIGRRQR